MIRKTTFAVSSILLLLTLAASPATAATVGEQAPAFELQDLSGETHSLADLQGKTVVLEWINPKCPFSDRHAREGTMTALADKYGEVVWLGINSTNPEDPAFLQPSEHAAWAEENGVDYAILYDRTGEVGHAYDAKTTPHMFIIDGEGTLVYDGAIDDDPPGRHSQAERTNYVDGALNDLAFSASVDPATTKPYGCSVNY